MQLLLSFLPPTPWADGPTPPSHGRGPILPRPGGRASAGEWPNPLPNRGHKVAPGEEKKLYRRMLDINMACAPELWLAKRLPQPMIRPIGMFSRSFVQILFNYVVRTSWPVVCALPRAASYHNSLAYLVHAVKT